MPAEARVGLRFGTEGITDVLQQIGLLTEALANAGKQTVNPYNPALSMTGAPGSQGTIQQAGEQGTFSESGYPAGLPPTGGSTGYSSGPSAPMNTGGNLASGSITVARADVINVHQAAVVNIYGGGGGATSGGGGGIPPSTSGAGAAVPYAGRFVPGGVRETTPAYGAFNPDDTIMPGGSMAGAPAPNSAAGGPPAWKSRSPFANAQNAQQYYDQLVATGASPTQLQDAQVNLQAAQAAQQRAQQQLNPADPGGAGGGLQGMLGGLLRGFGVHQALAFGAHALGSYGQYTMSGGDMTANRAATNFMTSIPILGGLMAPVIGPGMEKEELVYGAAAVRRGMGMDTEDLIHEGIDPTGIRVRKANTNLSPTYVQALQQSAMMGLDLPTSFRDRFAITDQNAEGYVHPAMRSHLLQTYSRLRRSPFGMSAHGFNNVDAEELDGQFGFAFGQRRTNPGSMGALAAATGDYESAMLLFGHEGDRGMQDNARRWGSIDARSQTQLMMTQATQSFGQSTASAMQTYGLTAANQGRLFSNYAGQQLNLGLTMAPLRNQLGMIEQQQAEASRMGDTEASAALQYRHTQIQTQMAGVQGQSYGLSVTQAQTPYSLELQRNMSRTGFEIGVLENTPGAYGNIRGAQMRQMQELQEAAEQVQNMRSRQSQQPGGITPQADFAYQERLQQIGMQQSQTFNQLSQGWQNRLISTVINSPGSFSMEGFGFSHRDAVMAGVNNAAMGSTRNQLPFFMRQAGLFDIPNQLPGVRMPLPGDAPGVLGPGDPFAAGGGGGSTPGTFPSVEGGFVPGGGSGSGAGVGGSLPGPTGPPGFVGPSGGGGGLPPRGPSMAGPRGGGGSAEPTAPVWVGSGNRGGGAFRNPSGHVSQGYAPARPRFDSRMRPGESMDEYVARRDAGLQTHDPMDVPPTEYIQGPGRRQSRGSGVGYPGSGVAPRIPSADEITPLDVVGNWLARPHAGRSSGRSSAVGGGDSTVSRAEIVVILRTASGQEIGRGNGNLTGPSNTVSMGVPLSVENTLAHMGLGVPKQ